MCGCVWSFHGTTTFIYILPPLPSLPLFPTSTSPQVDLQTLVGTTTIIPYTTFPLNTTGCGPTQGVVYYNCPFCFVWCTNIYVSVAIALNSSSPSLPSPLSPTVPPTLSPQQPGTACAALSGVASSQPLCSTNVACDQIDCSVQGYTTAMTVLPCTSPPSVRLTVTNPVGTQVYSQTLSQSRQVSILGGVLGLQVTVDQLDSALGIKVTGLACDPMPCV